MLDNRQGLIKGQTGLTIAGASELKNQKGELSTSGDLRITAERLVNADAGRIIAGGELEVQSGALDNHNGGLFSGWKKVTLQADTLDNSVKGTVSSREGSVSVQLTDALNNRDEGALVSKQALSIRAGEIDNGAGGILSSEAAVSLQAVGELINTGGLVNAGGSLSIQGSAINNQVGEVRSGADLLLDATDLDNSGGRFAAGQALSLTLTNRLLNTLGGQLASAGPLRLTAREIDNRDGQLASQGLLELFASRLDNSAAGTLAATGALRLDISGELDNSQDGLIYSRTDAVTAKAAALNNQAGAIQGKTALGLDVEGGVDNLSGRLLSEQGDVVVAAGSVSNGAGGLLTSLAGWVKATVNGVLDNQGGTIQADNLSLVTGTLDNRGGHVSAVAGDTTVAAGAVNNGSGGLYARDTLTITGANLTNYTGKIGAKTIDLSLTGTLNNDAGLIESGSTLALSAARLSNINGAIRALGETGATVVSATDTFDNRTGLLETANIDAQFALGSLLNTNGILRHVGTGSMALASDNAIEAGGTLTTTGDFSLTATSWTHGGTLQARNLTVNVGAFTQTATGKLLASEMFKGTGGNWINDGLIASDGALDLQLTGRYSGSGRLTSLGGMNVRVGAMTLDASARLTSGDYLKLDVAGALANGGRLTAGNDLALTAGTLLNSGTLGAADTVSLAATTLENDRGLIFSGADMTVAADAFTNAYGDFYSLGALTIGGRSNARAVLIDNISGSLEAAGDVYLQAKTLRNRREVFSLERTLVESAIGVYCYDCSGNHYTVDYIVRDIYEGKITDTTPAAYITAGRDLRLVGGAISNEGSSLAAVRNIDIYADSFANQGATGGMIERIRTYHSGYVTDGTVRRFFGDHAEQYNRAYNPDYPGYYYRTTGGELRLAVPYWDWSCGDCSEPGMSWKDSVTGQFVSIPVSYNSKYGFPSSQYNAEVVKGAILPSALTAYKLVSDVEIVRGGGSDVQNAVVQAGGNVTIQASKTLTNSVITSGSAIQRGASQVGSTSTSGTGQPLVVELISHLPPDLAQQQINPLTLPGFALPQGDNGLFRLSAEAVSSVATTGAGTAPLIDQPMPQAATNTNLSRPAGSHRYLIETSPALTDLKQFMSSDYLLGNLGYDTDATQKRLGDGLYEQRLIREAIVARTGHRYLAGLTSDEAMFRYLMDNALVSKNALGLSLGVSLTGEQVAALTHDIVWMEEHEVMGEKVLVPVLYLAQAEGRLAANGALIQGRDVTLISGGDLINQGTLRASNNLKAEAGNGIANRGLIEAGNRLELLASDSIRNAQGGIIAGRDVSLTALTGDVINERSVTRHEVNYGSRHTIQDYVDSAARIEAASSLGVVAGRDIANLGGVLESRGDLALNARRDVTIASVEERALQARGGSYLDEQVTQLGAQVSAGNDLSIKAGRDLTAIASQLDARRDASLVAGGDVVLASAANEDHFYSRSKKVTRSTDKIVQQSTTLQAGRDIAIDAGQDLTLVASNIKAGDNVALNAEQDINILSGKDESASFYFKKKKGSFGRSSSKQQENYDSTNVASVIEAGNDLTVNASKAADGGMSIDGGRDVTVIGSHLKAGGDLLVASTGDVAVLSGVEEHGSYSKKTKSGFLGLSKSGKSQLKTTASQVASELEAGNDVVIAAGNDVRLRASEARAGNDVELRAGLVTDTGDINLVSANDEAYSRSEEYKKKVGLSFSDAVGLAVGTPGFGGDITLASAKKAGQEAISSTNVGSQVIADRDATLAAERDINIVGSGVSAGRNVLLDAGRDVNVVAGTERTQTTSWENTKTFGMQQDFDRNGYTTFVGQEALKDKQLNAQQTAAASQISAGLNLDVKAGRDVVQQGSDMSAGYDLNVQAGRNILVDAAAEQSVYERETSQSRTGTTTTVNHNFGNMVDGLNGAGKGDNTVSQASSVLKAADGVSQFLSGPTFDGHVGSTSQSQAVTQSGTGNRGSSLDAGNDVTLTAGNSVVVKGGQLQSGRDIKVSAQDIVLDVARGEQRYEQEQNQAKGGFVGGTTGGFKVGIGGSQGTATQEGSQGTASGTQLQAGRDIVLDARNDLSLIGTQAMAERDIKLNAGNDLLITAAENAQSAEERRRSGGGEVGLTFGQSGIGVYASVNIGRGELDREGGQQQEAYLYAGRNVDMKSGRDTAITGAQIEGENVTGDVGRNLTVSSVPDTGKVSGKEFDASATVTVGYGVSVSGSVGYGQTKGETNWVGNQTSITARDRLDLRTEGHTQIDGALMASNTGNLKLDTDTLGVRDIQGEDKEHSYYLNAGGSYGTGVQDQSQVGKGEEGQTGWSLSGYQYEKEREQIVRATVGAGEIVVRSDAESGKDSTAGLNRDVSEAYGVTKDEEERTDLYVSKTSVEALGKAAERVANEIQAQRVSADQIPASAKQTLGEERAVSVAKNLVRHGLSPDLMGSLSPETAQMLTAWADAADGFDKTATGATKGQGTTESPSSSSAVPNGALDLGSVTTTHIVTPGEHFLQQTLQLEGYLRTLPVAEAQVVMLGMQALMGPAKAAIGLAGNVLLNAAFGDQINALKEGAAIGVTAGLTDRDKATVKAEHEEAKQEYAAGNDDYLNGDGYVLASRFLIDVVAGEIGSIGGKVAGRAIGVVSGPKATSSALQSFGGHTVDDLVSATANPINKEGLTEAARALTKHASGQRSTGTFPKLSGGLEKQNATAQGIVNEILKHPDATYKNLSRGGLEVRAPDGRGLRFNSDGSFSGFLDPKVQL